MKEKGRLSKQALTIAYNPTLTQRHSPRVDVAVSLSKSNKYGCSVFSFLFELLSRKSVKARRRNPGIPEGIQANAFFTHTLSFFFFCLSLEPLSRISSGKFQKQGVADDCYGTRGSYFLSKSQYLGARQSLRRAGGARACRKSLVIEMVI